MKGTVKLKKRLEALGLALLFMLQSVLGFLPGMIFSAAGAVKSIEVWDSDQLIDYGYRFNMKFQPGVPMSLLAAIIWTVLHFQITEEVQEIQKV